MLECSSAAGSQLRQMDAVRSDDGNAAMLTIGNELQFEPGLGGRALSMTW